VGTQTRVYNLRSDPRVKNDAYGKLFEKVIQKLIQRHLEVSNLHRTNQFGFRARRSMTFQCTRLTDHVTLNFNNNMITAAIFLDVEKAFDTIWHPGLLYKL